jgi:tyrosine-protein kinase Etk/Wzc
MQLKTSPKTVARPIPLEEEELYFDDDADEDGIDLKRIAGLLWQDKRTVLGFLLSAVTLSVWIAFFALKPTYTAEAVFLPPQSSPGSPITQLTNQLGSLGAGGALGGLKSSGDIYIGILGSRTVADALIKQFHLEAVYKAKRLSDAEAALKAHSKFTLNKNTLVTISVVDTDPRRAEILANGYLSILYEQNGRLALTESGQRRVFFEQQLQREKNALADAEVDLKRTEEQTGLIAPNGQTQVAIEAIQEIRTEITSRQVELSSLKQGATDLNPDVIRLQTEIERLQQELQHLQNDSAQRTPGSVQTPTAEVPELALEYVRKQREVKYHEALFDMLAKQYEAARLDESRDAPLLQVIDEAVVPDKKSGPHRGLLLFAGAFLGLIAGALCVLLRASLQKLNETPAPSA